MKNMLKTLFANSRINYSEVIRTSDHNKKVFSLVSCSSQMADLINVKITDKKAILISDIDFFVQNSQIDWESIFTKVLDTKEEIIFEYDCYTMNKYMQVKVFAPEDEHLIVLFSDITDQIEIADFSQALSGMSTDHLDFDKINEYVRRISGASFTILNLFTENNNSFITKSIVGEPLLVDEIIKLMGIKVIGFEWPNGKKLLDKTSIQRFTRYDSFRVLAEDILPPKVINIVEDSYNLGEVYIVTIVNQGQPIGNITFLMKAGELFRQRRLVESIMSQIGMVIEQRRTRKELFRSEEMFKSIFDQAPFGIAIVDLNNDKSYDLNQRYCEITGRHKNELLQVDWKDITHPDDIEVDFLYTQKIINGDFSEKSIEKRYLKPDGTYIWAEISIVPIYNVDNIVTHHIIMSNDITLRKKMSEKNEYLSFHDELTGLYNRHYYEAELKRLDTSRKLPLTIIFADVNGLKMTNDAYGHNSGDILLKRIAHIIKNECRKSEIVARVGGDEFIILLPQTTKKEANSIIKRINKKLEEASANNMILSVSFGVSVKKKAEESINDLIVHAEQEMYKDKLLVSQKVKTRIFQNMLIRLHELNHNEKNHSTIIGELTILIGKYLGFDQARLDDLKLFGTIHDIGKVGIDSKIIRSADKLNKQERKEIKRHSEIGYQIVSAVNQYSALAESILAHHERWDGKGYPNGLKGENIPIFARILSIVDAYEVMTGERDYVKGVLSREEAIIELEKNAGSQFDPNLVNVFKKIIYEYNDPRYLE